MPESFWVLAAFCVAFGLGFVAKVASGVFPYAIDPFGRRFTDIGAFEEPRAFPGRRVAVPRDKGSLGHSIDL